MSDKSVADIMGLAYRFAGICSSDHTQGEYEHCDKLLEAAVSALAAERDQAVKEGAHTLEVLGRRNAERDALKARVVELEKAVKNNWPTSMATSDSPYWCVFCDGNPVRLPLTADNSFKHAPDCIVRTIEVKRP